MKLLSTFWAAVALAQSASAHYIFYQPTTGGQNSSAVIRQPANNGPVEGVNGNNNLRCNANYAPATATMNVAAGSSFTFKSDNTLAHPGPGAIYLGQVPSGQTAATWDGSGANWCKIAEYGITTTPTTFRFVLQDAVEMTASIPASVRPGQYLLRAEHIGLHVSGAPQFYISCAQINITGGGSGSPTKVSIPGYVTATDPALTVNIHWPVPTAYKVPGPAVWRG
ncbi:glycoside hydrolase [Pterulicium gracile]|uniref:AA9 family lytic polysaccharide monooxygenase n=1 Tax=Pterulicium gracile TaxID=1884261 RepID=A0A5C3Q0D4_9AGAR|nr:glycoside hydrolase [Pterula gracilis]